MKTLLALIAIVALFVTGTFGSGCDVQWTTTGTVSFLKHPKPPAPVAQPPQEEIRPEKPAEPPPRPTYEIRTVPFRPGARAGEPLLIRYSPAPSGWEVYEDRRPAVAWVTR